MWEFLLFIFASIGFTNIMIDGSIFKSLREWIDKKTKPPIVEKVVVKSTDEFTPPWFWVKVNQLFGCPQCMGFWCGVICGIMLLSFNPLIWIPCGFAGSFLSVLASYLFIYLEANSLVDLENNG